MKKTIFIVVLLGGMILAGCRGSVSEKPPIHLNPNMDAQERFEAQEANPFFADGRAMRQPVPGTVARGMLKEDTRFFLGREADGKYVSTMPIEATPLYDRGRERYNIYCAVCHDLAGSGKGIIMTGNYGYTPAPSYHDPVVADRMADDGYVFDVISNGVRTMPGYAQQIPVIDRWAITAYIRALQRSQNATAEDVPASVLADIQQRGAASTQ